jgi:isopentenyldiphosphate isomerase
MFKENFKHREGYTDNEIHQIYLCKLVDDIQTLRIQKEELSEIRLISIDAFESAINKANFEKIYVPHYPDYYRFILKRVREKLNA